MKINSINNSYKSQFNSSYASFNGTKIKRENGYVMIPEKKYDRDKWLEYGLIALFLLIEIYRANKGGNVPK